TRCEKRRKAKSDALPPRRNVASNQDGAKAPAVQSIIPHMKKINTIELFLIVALCFWIANMNFAALSVLDFIGIGTAVVYCGLIVWKLLSR
ncbi:hypothetical protein, partial [Bacillus subtilis]|uniref:hypothetical protein n=2 Tax=Bacillus subtilis TaxID=1423 RepID=UPI002DBD7C0C